MPDKPHQTDEPFSAAAFVRRPALDAWVERREAGAFLAGWSVPATVVSIYAGPRPDAIDRSRPVAASDSPERQVEIHGLEMRPRPYFEFHFEGGPLDGRRVLAAERTLPLSSGVNFRDLGGYPAAGGRHVRWGRVYRSGSLAGLSDVDVAYLEGLGLRLVCDLRTPEEIAAQPDRLPAGATGRQQSIVARVNRLRQTLTLIRLRNRMQELLLRVYTVMLDQNGRIFGDVFRAAADPANLPLAVHCTAGKDRTGLAAALLLAGLGVDDAFIVADYTLSNDAFDVLAGRMRPEMERLYAFGLDDVRVRPLLLAEARTLESALAHVRGRYGSVEGYLRAAGDVDDATLARVRDNLLT